MDFEMERIFLTSGDPWRSKVKAKPYKFDVEHLENGLR